MTCRRAARSTGAPPPSFEAFQSKLSRVVCCHEQLKVSFDLLRSQIGNGLVEAEDVFVSLALQLMKLSGLKTAEMAEERRFSTIVTSFDCSQCQPEVDYMKKAIKAGNELIERQKLQLEQLITLLKTIEAQVNSSQKSIFQDLTNHQAYFNLKTLGVLNHGIAHLVSKFFDQVAYPNLHGSKGSCYLIERGFENQ